MIYGYDVCVYVCVSACACMMAVNHHTIGNHSTVILYIISDYNVKLWENITPVCADTINTDLTI